MEKIIEAFQYGYALRALMASCIVGITCGVLGSFVTLRRMALIGDAISHAILPGVVVGFVLFGHNSLAIFTGAVAAGLLTSVAITWIQRNTATKDDSSIGIVFTAMFALGVIGISWLSKQQGVHLDLKDFLFGNVLGVSNEDLWLTSLIGVYVALCVVLFYNYLFITTFDPVIAATMGISSGVMHYFLMFLLSLAIVASLQSVGVILVVAMLIIPSSAAYLLTNKLWVMLILSGLIGFISAVTGLVCAILWELPPGPTMTLAAVFFYLITLAISPKKGLITQWRRQLKKRLNTDCEDLLKKVYMENPSHKITLHELKERTHYYSLYLLWMVRKMRRENKLKTQLDVVMLTETGLAEAEQIVRAHRLWEMYLNREMGIPEDKIHEAAEKAEHINKQEFWDKVDSQLGFPEVDPHGSPIPQVHKKGKRKSKNTPISMSLAAEGADIKIWETQSRTESLWAFGILPQSVVRVISQNDQGTEIAFSGKKVMIPLSESTLINVIYLND